MGTQEAADEAADASATASTPLLTVVQPQHGSDLGTEASASGCSSKAALQWCDRLLPCCRWLRQYDWRASLQHDVVAGVTVGVMAVPQVVSFAAMAGLPAHYGLYSCLAPLLAYAVWGSSPVLAVGPVALVSLLLSNGLQRAVPGAEINPDPNHPADPAVQDLYNRAAIQVSLLVALLYLAMGAARAGWLTDVLSRPLNSAFLNAGAIIISLSQAKYLVGYEVPRDNRVQALVAGLWEGRAGFRWREAVMGAAWLAILFGIRPLARMHRRLHIIRAFGPIAVAVISIITVWALDLEATAGITTVGAIRPGLPPVTVRWWAPAAGVDGGQLVVTAGVIGAVGLLEAISIGKALAALRGGAINANQELFGLGAANLAGAAFGAYPVTGSFARSAVNAASGAATGLAGIVTAALVGLALLLLTPVFQLMPRNALAAIVIAGVSGLLDFRRPLQLLRLSKQDAAVWAVCFLVCLSVGIDSGLAAGVALSLACLLCRAAFPRIEVLAPPGAELGPRDSESEEDGRAAVMLRLAGPLCFLNIRRLEAALEAHLASAAAVGTRVARVELDMSAVTWLDTSAGEALAEQRRRLGDRGVALVFAGVDKAVAGLLVKVLADGSGGGHAGGGRRAGGARRADGDSEPLVALHMHDAVTDLERQLE